MTRTRILFLCTGNSCRSQMAEGWTRHLKGNRIEAESAGTFPGVVHPLAIKVMREHGVDISSQRSKHLDEMLDRDFDYVITLCDDAREACPIFPRSAKMVHRGFDDPTWTIGDEATVLAEFRRVRDEIRAMVEGLPESLDREGS